MRLPEGRGEYDDVLVGVKGVDLLGARDGPRLVCVDLAEAMGGGSAG